MSTGQCGDVLPQVIKGKKAHFIRGQACGWQVNSVIPHSHIQFLSASEMIIPLITRCCTNLKQTKENEFSQHTLT